jgi:hypothetical protein
MSKLHFLLLTDAILSRTSAFLGFKGRVMLACDGNAVLDGRRDT